MPTLRKQLEAKGFPADDEHCVIHKMFPQQLEKHLNNKDAKEAAAKEAAARIGQPTKLTLTVNGTRHDVVVEEIA
jgi:oxaloacetate decarboxylase alpha subunit/pyruvate carboxylase subunit B